MIVGLRPPSLAPAMPAFGSFNLQPSTFSRFPRRPFNLCRLSTLRPCRGRCPPASSQPPSQPASQPASQPPASQPPASQAASQPAASQPARQPASQPPASQPASQPSQAASRQPPAGQPVSQPASQAGSQPASQPASRQRAGRTRRGAIPRRTTGRARHAEQVTEATPRPHGRARRRRGRLVTLAERGARRVSQFPKRKPSCRAHFSEPR